MGASVDLANGEKKVIILMNHTDKGKPKILKWCSYEITAFNWADALITEKCTFEWNKNW